MVHLGSSLYIIAPLLFSVLQKAAPFVYWTVVLTIRILPVFIFLFILFTFTLCHRPRQTRLRQTRLRQTRLRQTRPRQTRPRLTTWDRWGQGCLTSTPPVGLSVGEGWLSGSPGATTSGATASEAATTTFGATTTLEPQPRVTKLSSSNPEAWPLPARNSSAALSAAAFCFCVFVYFLKGWVIIIKFPRLPIS